LGWCINVGLMKYGSYTVPATTYISPV
jgi:hypothetical protein